ncbi:MAG: methyltransferase [Desulfuromonadaceae bacterium]
MMSQEEIDAWSQEEQASAPTVQQATTQPQAGFTVGEKVEWIDLKGNAKPGTVFSVDGENITVATDKGGRVPLKMDRVRKVEQQAAPAGKPVSSSLPKVPKVEPKPVQVTKEPWEITKGEWEQDALYHGGKYSPDEYDVTKASDEAQYGKAFYAGGEGFAEEWAKERGGTTHRTKLKMDQPFDEKNIDSNNPMHQKVINSLIEAGLPKKFVESNYGGLGTFEFFASKLKSGEKSMFPGSAKMAEILKNAGFDGIIGEFRDSLQYAVFDNEQVLTHKKEVQKALSEGKPVSREALADYPELTKQEVKSSPAEAATAPTVGENESPKAIMPAGKENAPQAAPGGAVQGDQKVTLEQHGLKITKGTTKSGKTVWEVTGNTKEYKDALGRAGGRWFGPKKSWSYYGDADPTERILSKLPPVEKMVEVTPTTKESKSFKATMYYGKGKSKEKIYSGLQKPIMGEGKYYAFTESDAKEYGDQLTESEVTLKNPLIITNDAQWRSLTKKAGWTFPNPYGANDAEVLKWIDSFKDMIVSMGHDGIVIQMEPYDTAKTMRNLFGHDQVVVYGKQEAKAAGKEPAPSQKGEAESEKSSKAQANTSKALRTQAQSMQKTIDAKRNPGVASQNPTARRANIAAGMAMEADRLENIQSKLNAVADAIEAGTLPESLNKLTKKTQVEALKKYLNRAKYRREREQKVSYQDSKNTPVSEKDVAFASFEDYAHSDHLKDLLKVTEKMKGVKEARDTVQTIVHREGRIYSFKDVDAIEELLRKAENSSDKSFTPKYIKEGLADFKRLRELGIENTDQLQQILKDYLSLGVERKAPTKDQKVKELERGLLGQKFPGYFPTPRAVVEGMLENADIEPGMSVLEPSAGKGNIADIIRENEPGAKLDVIEIQKTLRDVLEAKGHKVLQDNDFLEYSPENKYDRIIMNPPFEQGQGMEHIKHAYELLKPGGRLVSIMSEGPFFRGDKKATAFREWLEELSGTSEKLPEKSFTGKDADRQTGVAARMVVIEKTGDVKLKEKPESVTITGKITTAKTERGTEIKGELSSLDEVQEAMNRKIDDEIGDVNPPAGFSIKIVGKTDKDIKTEFVHTPQKTSLNQVATGLRKAIAQKVFTEGMTVIDVGGGAYDKGVEFLSKHGVNSFVYDPYARSKEHNDSVLRKIKDNEGADAAALNNVLNVIPTDKERANVLQFMYQFLKPGGKAVITVYEGNGTGVSSRLIFNDGNSTWQENRKLADYEKEIREALPEAEITKKMGMYVVAKPTESFDEIRSDLKRKVDKKIGKVIPPMGFHIQWVEDPARLATERGEYSFENSEIEERFQAANGMPEESFFVRVKEVIRTLYNKAHREYEHLPRNAEFAELRKDLLKLAKQRGVAGDKTLRLQQGITINLDPYKFDLFRRYAILADLVEEAKAGHSLPFGFTEDTLEAEWGRINNEVDKHQEIREAITDRQKIWKAIVREYTSNMRAIGFNVDRKFTKESYYRHQVIEYAKLKGRAMSGTGQKLKTPTGRGFLRQRGGSEMDINTNYLQAEYEVMAQMLYDIEVAKTIKAVDDNYNIQKRLKQEAKDANQRAMNKIVARQDEIGQMVEAALKSFKIKLGMSFGRLRKHAESGDLWTGDNDEYQGIVDQLRDGYGSDIDDERNRLFKYLSALLVREDVGSMEAATILKALGQRREFIKETLGKDFKTWEDIIPDGYTVWQPREGNIFFMSETIPGHLAEKLFTDQIEQLGISKDDLNRALTIGGRRKEFVVKQEIADTLDNLTKPTADDLLHKIISEPLRAWKVWQLLSPRRWFKYNFRNMSGDAEAVFIGNPRAFAKLPRAARELYDVFAGDKSMTADMQGWFERGGMETLLQVQELGEINNLRMFLKLNEKKGSVAKIPLKAWQVYWKAVRLSTDYREALLRYSSYLSYLQQMEKSGGQPKNFGASIPEEIMALKDNSDRAFKLSNELLGAYDEISVIGQGLRKYLMPFWSWNEVNFRRTIQLFKNAARDEKLAYAVGRKLIGTAAIRIPFLAMKVGKFAIMAFAMWTLLTLWNNMKFPEEEKELPENVKSRPHIVFGRDKDGKILYFDRLGFVQDFLSWFGLDKAPLTAKELINGKITLKEFALESAKAPINKLWQSIGPHIKLPVEEALGAKTFPDVFKPGKIRDRWQYLAESFGLGNEYKQLAGKPVPTVEGSRGRGYLGSLRDVFTYSADPGQSAYYDVLDEKRRFMKKLNKPEGYSTSPRSEALYNFKLSIRYKDKEAARKYLLEYAMLGGTVKGLSQSLKTMDPLYGLNDEEKLAFVVSLDQEDRQKMVRALQYYQTVLLGK